SVLLIVYGATAGVSVVQLYAGAFFPGLMLAGLYVLYVIVLAKLRPKLMPPLPESERRVPLAAAAERVRDRFGDRALPALLRAIKGRSNVDVAMSDLLRQLFVTLLPALAIAVVIGLAWRSATAPSAAVDTGGLEQLGGSFDSAPSVDSGGLAEPGAADGEMSEPTADDGELAEPEAAADEADGEAGTTAEAAGDAAAADAKPQGAPQSAAPPAAAEAPAAGAAATVEAGTPVPTWFWVLAGIGAAFLLAYYALLSFARLEIFRMLLSSFFPLAVLILAEIGRASCRERVSN